VDYILKPFTGGQLLDAIGRALSTKRAGDSSALARHRGSNVPEMPNMLGGSPAFRTMLGEIRRVAPLEGNVLIHGETGSGKELVARAVHAFSKRSAHALVVVNCAAIPENLSSRALRHDRGAFTGAVAAKAACSRRRTRARSSSTSRGAHARGTSEAAALPRREGGAACRLGPRASGGHRVIAATHKNLAQQVREGRFREDLFYRLSVLDVNVPPLRDRPEDVLPLAVAFLDRLCQQCGLSVVGFTDEAIERLMDHPCPETSASCRTRSEGLLRAESTVITAEDLVLGHAQGAAPAPGTATPQRWTRALAEFEREHVNEALERNDGNVTHAAKALGVHRTTLQRLMKRLGLPSASP